MIIKEAKFLTSSDAVAKCPKPEKPEYAFIGRSNVGKSSLINMLTNNARLAKISGKPGKTRLINHFEINNNWFLVDLPGYGYAKASKSDRKKWEIFIRNYLTKRENLYCVFVLIDIRIEPQPIDLDFMEWIGENQIPFVIVFTKADKIKPAVIEVKVEAYRDKMSETWVEIPQMFVSSAINSNGRDQILDFIDQVNQS
jgi:GTP-binding protein